ncbi:MAG: LysR family transcriptional regulator [Clostridia bacterium]|nr:LysR family transcriptional regulator [Clostridia bacterium]MCL6522623.1 LysR family transcriptional regulator [Bacillota bacterium]
MALLLQHLLTFRQVVERGSFTAAAEALHVTQSTVTRQVAALERDFGAVLLERHGAHPRLTEAGQLVYECALRVAENLEECRQRVRDLETPGHGQVAVGCVETLVPTTLAELLQTFTGRYPDVRVQVLIAAIQETVNRLLNREIDVALLTTPVNDPRIESHPLFEDPILFVAHPRLARQLPERLEVADLPRLPLITHKAGSRFRALVDSAMESVGILPRVVMEFDSHEAVRVMAELGLGVGLLPASTVEDAVAAGRLLRLRVEGFPELRRTTTIALLRHRHRSAALRAFVETVLQRYRGEAGGNRPERDLPPGGAS